jgi:hypothetical protein
MVTHLSLMGRTVVGARHIGRWRDLTWLLTPEYWLL